MTWWPLRLLFRAERSRPDGESCKNCRFVDDYSDTEPADEANAYCTRDFVKTGFTVNEYGGHWTHTDSWCDGWEKGPSIWQRVDDDTPQTTS